MRTVLTNGQYGWGPEMRPYDEYEKLKLVIDRIERGIINNAQIMKISAADDAFCDRELDLVLDKNQTKRVFELIRELIQPRFNLLEKKYSDVD